MFNIQAWVFRCYILSTFKLMQLFGKVIMHNDVTGCVIFKSNKIEYLEK